jgi:hypothetical protein
LTQTPYTGRANRYEGALLERLKDGRVNVCGITNRAWVNGKEYATFPDHNGYIFFRVVIQGKRRTFSMSRAVWMKHARRRIPPRFEVHHINEDNSDNAWENLAPIYKPDHPKFAGMVHRPPDDDEVPF